MSTIDPGIQPEEETDQNQTPIGAPDGPTQMKRTTAWIAAAVIAAGLVAIPIGLSKADFQVEDATQVEQSSDSYYVIYLPQGWTEVDLPQSAPANSTAYGYEGVTLVATQVPGEENAEKAAQAALAEQFPDQAESGDYFTLTGSRGVVYRVENTSEPTFVYAVQVDEGLVVGYSFGEPTSGGVSAVAQEIFSAIGSLR